MHLKTKGIHTIHYNVTSGLALLLTNRKCCSGYNYKNFWTRTRLHKTFLRYEGSSLLFCSNNLFLWNNINWNRERFEKMPRVHFQDFEGTSWTVRCKMTSKEDLRQLLLLNKICFKHQKPYLYIMKWLLTFPLLTGVIHLKEELPTYYTPVYHIPCQVFSYAHSFLPVICSPVFVLPSGDAVWVSCKPPADLSSHHFACWCAPGAVLQ